MRTETELAKGWQFALEGQEYKPVTLPHDWAIGVEFDRGQKEGASQGFRSRFGIGRYQKELTLPRKQEGHCYLLAFGGIYEDSTVYVNGKEAGGRKYGYSSFALDITEFLEEGRNLIEVRVDNTKRPSDRWYSGAGIYRAVKLIEVECVHFEPREVIVQTQIEGDTATVRIHAGLISGALRESEVPETGSSEGGRREKNLEGGAEKKQTADSPDKGSLRQTSLLGSLPAGLKICARLSDSEGNIAATAEGGEDLELSVRNAKLWSAEDPNLYGLTLTLREGERIADQIHLSIGLRAIEMVPGKGMYVNGKPVKLNGVCIHQDTGCMGVASRKEIYRQRLLALKEAGCNAVRPAHHTFDSEFLDLCDELGFYVYEECFDKWHGGLYGRYFETQWRRDVDAMVKRDRNRPCVFMWGVGNEVENQGQESMLSTLKLLTDYVRTLDHRPVSYAMNPHFKREENVDLKTVTNIQKFVDEVSDTEIYDNEERVERIAKIAEYVDVISCNYQEQWYPLIHKRVPDKLILGTEVYQYFSGAPDQMQNFTDVNPVLAVKALDYCMGSFIWTGIDYLGESMGWPAKGWGGSLIRTNGSRRPGYYLMQSYWGKKPMVHFSVMDYSLQDEGVKEHWDIPMLADHWQFPQFGKTVIPYVIMSNCEEVRLFLNGKRYYVKRPAECPNRIVSGFLPWLPGKVEAVGVNGGKEVCRHIVRTPGPAVRLMFTGDAWTGREACGDGIQRREAASYLPGIEGYQIQLAVNACDRDGNPCFRESAKVRFRVEGPAEILAVDAGDLTGDEPYRGNACHMYRGQASVMIAVTGEPGRIRVVAEAEGMVPGDFVLVAEPVEACLEQC